MSGRPKLPSEAELERAAIAYLERYGGSTERVRRALMRRVRRAMEGMEEPPEDATSSVEAVLTKLTRLGYLDDARFTAHRVRALRRRGKSGRTIRAALAAQKLDASDALRDEDPDAELAAARALVRRRRLGPYRPEDARATERQRDLARLARAGFAFDVAVKALESDG
jgi:regulatory protein